MKDNLMDKKEVIKYQYFLKIKYNQDSKGRIIGKYKNLGKAIARLNSIKEDNNLSYESLEIYPNYKTKNIFGAEGVFPIYIYDLGQKDSEVIFANNLEEEKLLAENFLSAKRY